MNQPCRCSLTGIASCKFFIASIRFCHSLSLWLCRYEYSNRMRIETNTQLSTCSHPFHTHRNSILFLTISFLEFLTLIFYVSVVYTLVGLINWSHPFQKNYSTMHKWICATEKTVDVFSRTITKAMPSRNSLRKLSVNPRLQIIISHTWQFAFKTYHVVQCEISVSEV